MKSTLSVSYRTYIMYSASWCVVYDSHKATLYMNVSLFPVHYGTIHVHILPWHMLQN